jgi:mitogen-activated protein kinase kinase 1
VCAPGGARGAGAGARARLRPIRRLTSLCFSFLPLCRAQVRALYAADCDALVAFHGAFVRDSRVWLALEYMDCGTLGRVAALAPGRRLPERALAGAAFQLMWALAYLRVEKLLHRDIKPSNVLVNSAGQVKLSDFGTSAALDSTLGMAATFTGTCRYMSPERIQRGLFSFPADVWSAGMLLLECATGRYPYAGADSYIDAAEAIVGSPPPTLPPDLRAAFEPGFEQLLAACLAKAPEDRLPADIILQGSPWFAAHGIGDLPSAMLAVRDWLATLPPAVVIALPVPPEALAAVDADAAAAAAAAAAAGAAAAR